MSDNYRSTLGERMATPGRVILTGRWNEESKCYLNYDELLAVGKITKEEYEEIKEWNSGAGADVNGKFIGFPDDFVFPENLKIPEEKK